MFDPEAVDRVLLQLGKWGRFQLINCIVFNMPVLFSALYTLTYVFTAQNLKYRCLVPECESKEIAEVPGGYLPPWLGDAVPFDDKEPEDCLRFVRNATSRDESNACAASLFNRGATERCSQWVYEPEQRNTLVSEWDLTCSDNQWKLTLVGTIGYVGAFLGMPLAGIVSDRFGRKTLLFWIWTLTSLSGLIHSFATNYVMFMCFEFLDRFLEAGVYGAGFILALEFVGPKQRVMATTILSVFYSSGNAILGMVAWAVQDWRWLLRAVFGCGIIFAVPLWFAPESVRWLASRGRIEEADAILTRVAAMNGVKIKETLADVARARSASVPEKEDSKMKGSNGTFHNLIEIFKSRILLVRFIVNAFSWGAITFVYYGLSLNAVSLSGNEYLNFILSGLVEIPANLLALWLQDRAGRRLTLVWSFVCSGICCLAFLAIPADVQWLQVTVYMMGKFAVTIPFSVIYVITAEMFPTNVRHSMVSYGSTFGRAGSFLAPQTPLLATVNESLPLIIFGTVAVVSGALAMLFPETAGRPLPETIADAESMSANRSGAKWFRQRA